MPGPGVWSARDFAIAVAGINMMIFEFITVRDVQKWNVDLTPPPRARLAGGISIACWVLVIVRSTPKSQRISFSSRSRACATLP